jgi:hypothetical protein
MHPGKLIFWLLYGLKPYQNGLCLQMRIKMRQIIIYILLLISLDVRSQWWHNAGISYVPNYTGAAQIWSGKIVGDSLICDKGPNMAITGKDFDSNWTYGLPIKSVATISQLASSYGVVPNPDSIWFDGNHVPRQIPICLFFQDMDYVHQIFTRILPQILDANGVETYQSRVSSIVTYSAVQSGANLINENLWFLVPAKPTGAKIREAGPGKTYSTITLAINASNSGDTILVYRGTYSETIVATKYLTIIGVGGFSRVVTTTGLYAVYSNSNPNIERLYFSTAKTNLFSAESTAVKINVKNCYCMSLTNLSRDVTWAIAVNLDGCVMGNYTEVGGMYLKSAIIKNSYLKNIRWIARTGTDTISYLNNKIYKNHATTTQAITLNSGNLIIKGNNISVNATVVSVQPLALMGTELQVSLSHNNVTGNTTNSAAYSFFSSLDNNARYHWDVSDNKFTSYSTTLGGYFFSIKNATFDIKRNIFIAKCRPQTPFTCVGFDHQNGLNLAGGKFNNNYIECNTTAFGIGSDGSAFANIYNGTEIIGNTLIGSYRDNPTYLGGQHGFTIINGINHIIKHNYIYGCAWALVVKNCNQAYTTGGFWGNVLHNNFNGFHIAGLVDVNIFNNTTVNDQHFTIFNPVPYISYTYAQSQNKVADYPAINNIYKNNISYTTESVGTMAFFSGTTITGCLWENGLLYGGNYIFGYTSNYETLAAAQAAGYLANCLDANPNIVSSTQLWPSTPITGNASNVGAPYNCLLKQSTFWGDTLHIPSIDTMTVMPQLGAYGPN